MTSKERVIVALSHEEPDRVPITASFTPEFASRLRQHLGLPPQDLNPHGGVVHDLEEALGLDIIQYSVGIANSYYASSEDVYVCEWGITWKQVEYETPFGRGRYTEIARYPLSQDENIASYVPPDPHREELYAPLQEVLKRYGKDYFILGVTVCTIFEGAWYRPGFGATSHGYGDR